MSRCVICDEENLVGSLELCSVCDSSIQEIAEEWRKEEVVDDIPDLSDEAELWNLVYPPEEHGLEASNLTEEADPEEGAGYDAIV